MLRNNLSSLHHFDSAPLPNSYPVLHKGPTGRAFKYHAPIPCYALTAEQKAPLSGAMIHGLATLPDSSRKVLHDVEIPACDAVAVSVPAGSLVRVAVTHGPQVADLNVWNAVDWAERLYTSKTRQIHATHLTVGDSLWSSFPAVRPLMTIVADTVAYGIDADNAGVHDVIGSRCDPYTHSLMTDAAATVDNCCHSNLTRAVRPFGLAESDVHDVLNVFMCTGFTPDKGIYFTKPTPAKKGDYLELFTHFDVIVAVSACRQGDVATACGDADAVPTCYPLGLQVFGVPDSVLHGWTPPEKRIYNGNHGM